MAVEDDIIAQIMSLSREPMTKSEIVEYYQRTFSGRGAEGWRQHIQHDLADLTGKKEKNLSRRFDPSRLNNIPRTKREKEEYIKLGEKIGPVLLPENGLIVDFDGEIKISTKCYPRKFSSLYIDPESAQELAETGDFHIIMEEYFQGQDIAEDLCGDPTITIKAAKPNQPQMAFKHEMHGPSAYAAILRK